MQAGSVTVAQGQAITVGTPIGKIGNTGYTFGFSHLHYSWLAVAQGTGESPMVGNSLPGSFLGIGNPTTGQNLVSNNPGLRAQHASVALIPKQGASGYRVDGHGVLHPFGTAPRVTSAPPRWPGWDIVRGIALFPNSTRSSVKGYVLDGWGGIHPFAAGSADPPHTPRLSVYWKGWDIARGIALRGNTGTGYVLDGWGGIHPFTSPGVQMPPRIHPSGYWKGWDIARGIALTSAGSGYVLDGWGGIHPFAAKGLPMPQRPHPSPYWGWDIASGIAMDGESSGYVLDGWGGIHPFGGAPAVKSPAYRPYNDIFRGIAFDPYTHTGVDITGDRGSIRGTYCRWHR